MNSRERVKRAIHFQGVDHIPHYLPDGKENDIMWFWTPRVPDKQPWTAGGDQQKFRSEPLPGFVLPADAGSHGEISFKGREAWETSPPIMCPGLSVLSYDKVTDCPSCIF